MRNSIFLLVVFGSFPISSGAYHQYTTASEAGTVDNEATYAGRTFDEWRTLSLNDLDSATRAQAFKAFAAFAPHGRREESFAAIKAALAREKSRLEIKEGYSALRRLGEIGLPALIEGVRHDDAFHRLTAIETFNSYTNTVSEDAVSAVADAICDDDVKIGEEFGVTFPDELLANIDGTVDSLIRATQHLRRAGHPNRVPRVVCQTERR